MSTPRRKIQEEEKPDMINQIIVRSHGGETELQIAQALGLTRHQVRQLKASPDYMNLLKKQKEEAEKRIVSQIVTELESMTPAFLEGLKKNLQEGKPESQKLFVEMVGLRAVENKDNTGTQSMTVILPGAREEKVIEVKGEAVE